MHLMIQDGCDIVAAIAAKLSLGDARRRTPAGATPMQSFQLQLPGSGGRKAKIHDGSFRGFRRTPKRRAHQNGRRPQHRAVWRAVPGADGARGRKTTLPGDPAVGRAVYARAISSGW